MPKFEVIVKRIEIYEMPSIEAENEKEAKVKADEMLEDDVNKASYHHDSDCEIDAYEI